MRQRRKIRATSCGRATYGNCRGILTHHADVYAFITEDLTKLVAAALYHCAKLSASEEALPATAMSLRECLSDQLFSGPHPLPAPQWLLGRYMCSSSGSLPQSSSTGNYPTIVLVTFWSSLG